MMSEFDEFDTHFKKMREVSRTYENRMASLAKVLDRRKKKKFHLIPIIATVVAATIVFILVMTLDGSAPFENAETITDNHTVQNIPFVEVTGKMFTIEYGLDNMDRGNHDYLTADLDRKLVVNPEIVDYGRGDVVYHKTPIYIKDKDGLKGDSLQKTLGSTLEEFQISRVVGLPGEMVEIKKGQIYINNRKLETYYSFPTIRGMNKNEYMETIDPKNTEITAKDFEESLEPILVPADTVFVLGDQWWRSIDSRIFGALSLSEVEGKVLGYEKQK